MNSIPKSDEIKIQLIKTIFNMHCVTITKDANIQFFWFELNELSNAKQKKEELKIKYNKYEFFSKEEFEIK